MGTVKSAPSARSLAFFQKLYSFFCMEFSSFYRLACALAIGLIIGLQREGAFKNQADVHPAGIRTFSITGLLGAIAALLSMQMGTAVPFIGVLVVLGLILAVSHATFLRKSEESILAAGLTTTVAMLAVFLMGGLCYYGKILESVATAIAVLGLLTLKDPLHSFAHRVSREDIVATLKFALISAVILPILPKTAYGPPGLEVISPYKIWLFVCFISGISFIGYVLIKWIGPGKGIGLTGLFGGLASSTALTLSLSGRSKDNPEFSGSLTTGIVIAWSVMYLRVYLICILFVPATAKGLALALLIPPIPGLIYAYFLHRRNQLLHPTQNENFTNPFNLLPSIKFGFIFAVVLFVANATQKYFGSDALLLSSFITGLADMDAITLSVLDMTKSNTVLVSAACKAIALAALANTLCKGVLACVIGDKNMRRAILPAMGIIAVASFLMILLFV